MKIITLHTDYIKFKPLKKALKKISELSNKEKKGDNVKDALTVLIAVEKTDTSINEVVKKLIENIKEIAKQVNAKKIVLYPYAHLSTNLSSPELAIEVLEKTEKELKKNFNVTKAPFGYYKEFEMKVKGHPLSELSREIKVEGEEKSQESEALKAEKKLKSYWKIMTPDGKMKDVDKFNYKGYENLKKFAYYEKSKSREVVKEPAHIKIMKKLELVDYEPGSDSGNLRYYPKGRMIKALIEEYVNKRVQEYGGMEVETPIMYDMKNPILERYLNKFPARQYQIESDKRNFFLRFAACFGQFLMVKDASISYKDLPLKIYELTRYSFRREQSGEVAGLRRLRAFTMPDVHAFCNDMNQAMEEYKIRFKLSLDVLEKIGLKKEDVELAVRFTKEFYNKNQKFVEWIIKEFGRPVLIEMWDKRSFYFILKYELNFIDSVDKAAALSTDQIDVENAERYGIKFTDKNNKKKYPLILHCSPSGAIERVMYALLEKAEISGNHSLPYWLSPTQIRLLPISDKFNDEAETLAKEFSENNIRADVDDRNETTRKKIVNSEKEWIPFTILIGEKEIKGNEFMLRERRGNIKFDPDVSLDNFSKAKLISKLKLLQNNMPWKPLPLPVLISKRPVFI
jgi:threonyl-tRNA synthetase|tara:strand:- start:1292 stop:3169 length:1878 start_codon:yes stop_codon:yes gene_type:complete